MSITDDGVTFECGSYHNECRGNIRPRGPTVQLMRDVLKWYLKSHPVNSTLVEQEMRKHEILFTPQYESWLQPIELIWARVKYTVAMKSCHGRPYQETAAQTRAALSAIEPELCVKLIQRCERMMDDWLSTSESGSLGQWGTLAKLIQARHEEIAAAPDTAEENVKGVVEVDEEKENQTSNAKKNRKKQVREVIVEMTNPQRRRSNRVRKQVYL